MFIHIAALGPLLLASCGEPVPRAEVPPPTVSLVARPSANTSALASASTGTASASTEPTLRTDEQKKRDDALVPLASAIVDAYPNWNGFFSDLVAEFSPDGKHFVYGSLRDGAPEIYLGDVAHPSEPPLALTHGPQRALSASFAPGGQSILFMRDEGGDENESIWRVKLDGTGLEELTPGEKLRRSEPVVPRGMPGTMLYEARSASESATRFYAQSLDGVATPRLIYKEPLLVELTDVAPDGKHVAFSRIVAKGEEQLMELDVATGATRLVYPPAGQKFGFHGGRYSADSRRFIVSTDEGRESAVLLSLETATGKEVARYVNEAPNVELHLQVAPKGDRVALAIDKGNHGEVRILDAKTLTPVRDVKVPLGEIALGTFAPDGRVFSLRISLPAQPSDLFAVDTATGDVRPLRDDKRNGLSSLPAMDVSLATVPAHDGLSLPVNVYRPKDDRNEQVKRRPVIAIFHGGPQVSYQVRWSLYARFFVSLGYVVLEPNVRGSSGFGRAYEMADDREKRADWLLDLATINAWARHQPWCDPERIVVWGQSYGGYTTLMAMTRQPTLWRAGVDLYGIADLKALLRTTNATGRVALGQEFGDLEKDGALLDSFSPARAVDALARPLFVYAGQNDARVPRSESDFIVQAARKKGVTVEYMVAANEGHGVDHRETKIELMTRTARFLEDALK